MAKDFVSTVVKNADGSFTIRLWHQKESELCITSGDEAFAATIRGRTIVGIVAETSGSGVNGLLLDNGAFLECVTHADSVRVFATYYGAQTWDAKHARGET